VTAEVKPTNSVLAACVGLALLLGSLFFPWSHVDEEAFVHEAFGSPGKVAEMNTVAGSTSSCYVMHEIRTDSSIGWPVLFGVGLGVFSLLVLILNARGVTNFSAAMTLLPFAGTAAVLLYLLYETAYAYTWVTPGVGLFMALTGLGVGLLSVFKPRRMAPQVPFAHPTE